MKILNGLRLLPASLWSCVGVVPGVRFFFSNAVFSNIFPSTLVVQIFVVISVIIKVTAHFSLNLFDLM